MGIFSVNFSFKSHCFIIYCGCFYQSNNCITLCTLILKFFLKIKVIVISCSIYHKLAMFSVLKKLCTKLLRSFGIGGTCLDLDECASFRSELNISYILLP